MASDNQVLYWLFYLPQFALAALMYTLLGRFILSLFFKPGSDKVLWRAFETITQPFINGTRALTPHAVPDQLIVLFAFVWALLARLGLFVLLWRLGATPGVGG